MLRSTIGVALILLASSCGKSQETVRPSTEGIVVSANPSDHPDYLCDGVEDEVEINQAIVEAESKGGGVVQLKPGRFTVRRRIVVRSNVTLRGSGIGTVVFLENNAPSMVTASGVLRLKMDERPAAARRVQNVTLEDFVVDGNRANQDPIADEKKAGIYSEGDYIVFRRIVVRNCAGYGFDPHAYEDTIPSTHMTIEGCEAHGNRYDGFALDMVQNSMFVNNYSHDNDRHGVNVLSGAAAITIVGSRMTRNGVSGLTAQNGARDFDIQGCELSSNGEDGLYLRDGDGCRVRSNTLKNNRRSGMILRGTDGGTVFGNVLTDNSFGTSSYAEILIDDYLSDDATDNVVESNIIRSAGARAGIMEAGLADYNRVDTNNIEVTTRHVVLVGTHSTQAGNILH